MSSSRKHQLKVKALLQSELFAICMYTRCDMYVIFFEEFDAIHR